jgi:predicted O-linked N-acetylglucosamine transferase (SPINDLY family)
MSMTESPASPQVAMPDAAPAKDALAQAIEKSLTLALKYHEAGELEHAETLYRGILEMRPEHAVANFLLARLAVSVGQAPAALPHFTLALEEQPNKIEYRIGYIDALIRADELDTAREQLALAKSQPCGFKESVLHSLAEHLELRTRVKRTIRDTQLSAPVARSAIGASALHHRVKAQPNPKDLGKLGALYQQKRYAEASTLARSLTLRFPNNGFAWKVLGAAANAQGDYLNAVHPMEMAAKLMPVDAEARVNLARTLDFLGRHAEAEVNFRHVLELDPNDSTVHFSLANLLKGQARLLEAELHCLRALEIDPAHIHGHWMLGNILKETHRLVEAEESYRKALDIDSTYAYGHNQLGTLILEQDRSTEAEAAFRDAIAAEPMLGASYTNLGLALNAQGRQGEASESFRRAVQLQPDVPEAHTALLFSLSHSQTIEPEALLAEHCRFGEIFEAPLRSTWRPHENSRDPDKPLQIGFVSGDLCNHAVASFLEPVLRHLARYPSLVLHAYSTRATSGDDSITRRLREHLNHWHGVAHWTQTELAAKVRADCIDILIDLSGHTSANRLMVFAQKPAPVQASWMGYPGTTGLQSMDYYLCDRFILPPGFESQFTEKLVRLPANAPFQPFANAPPVNDLPALQAGHLTFGSFNRLDKFNRRMLVVWSQLLRAVPSSRLILGAMPQGGDNQYESLIQGFAEEGIDRQRLEFHERTHMLNYLTLHHKVDICLDTFPYNGGTTSLHSLWMGVPTLTIAGRTMPGRVGAGLLGHLGLEDFAASDEKTFVAQGAAWAQRLPELARLRADLRDRFVQSAIGQPALIAAGLESALRTMWQRWCAGLPAESFEAQVAQGERA